MYDYRPQLLVKGQICKYYKSKNTNKLKQSVGFIKDIDSSIGVSCRETLVHKLGDSIKRAGFSTSNTTYTLNTLIFETSKGNSYYGKASIDINISSVIALHKYYNGIPKDKRYLDLAKAIDYIVGITSTAMSQDDKEIQRSKYKSKDTRFSVSSSKIITYSPSSNYWLISPVTVSIITGLTRNVISHLVTIPEIYDSDEEIDMKSLFSEIDYKTIKNVIDTHNVSEAKSIYRKVIVPFYTNLYKQDLYTGGRIFLGSPDTRKVITNFVEDGVYTYFNPDELLNYWNYFHMHYGLDDFIEDFGTSKKDWKNSLGMLATQFKSGGI
jgi:hypothetical protein